jgi:hypothetical protein
MADQGFFDGGYARGTTNDAQRAAREILARKQLEVDTTDALAKAATKPISAVLNPDVLDPLRGSKFVAKEAVVARVLDMDAGSVANRIAKQHLIEQQLYNAAPLPVVTLSAALIEEQGRDFKQRLQQELQQEQFLRQYSETLNLLVKTRACLTCGSNFAYCDSINAWQCRFHTGFRRGSHWDCCGLPAVSGTDSYALYRSYAGWGSSCTPIDHLDLDPLSPGSASGRGMWMLPLALVKALGPRKLWKPAVLSEKEGRDLWGARVWDIRARGDITAGERAAQMASRWSGNVAESAGRVLDPDSDTEDRVLTEARVRKGTWASRAVDDDSLQFRYANPEAILAERRRDRYDSYAAKRDFVFLPVSPVPLGPFSLVNASNFDFVTEEARK